MSALQYGEIINWIEVNTDIVPDMRGLFGDHGQTEPTMVGA